jgi:hypothetical protein
MRTLCGIISVALLSLAPPAGAQLPVDLQIQMGLPVVLPPMVVVQPGLRVVSELDEEVYFVGGWYWVRRGPHWYRARDHRRAWMWIEPRRVPVVLVRIPPGQYRKIDHARWKAEQREWKERRKADRARWKAEQKGGKHGGRKHGRGHDD